MSSIPARADVASDHPKRLPSEDLFNFDPAARNIAASIAGLDSRAGLVLAITGGWGTGKSTMLNFVIHHLEHLPEKSRPVVIEFNPWWFSSREDLAPQIITAFKNKLPSTKDKFDDLRKSLDKYAGVITATAAFVTALPVLNPLVQLVLKLFGRRSYDIRELKNEICRRLLAADTKFVFVIDDIDRLAPTEVADLIRAIKALGDFPNVVYVLSFDHAVVADAVAKALNVDGISYLEKIVQASFAIPAIDRIALRKWFFESLDKVLAMQPAASFSDSYWAQVFFDSIDPLVRHPRDVVRVINSLAISYPAVAREVNSVDFIALEVLRIFEPRAYESVKDNMSFFVGRPDSEKDALAATKAFHETWLARVPRRETVVNLLSHLFPKFGQAMSDGFFLESGPGHWRQNLRVCNEEIFPTYFHFGVVPGRVGRAQIEALVLSASDSSREVVRMLRDATRVFQADGSAQIGELLDRLNDVVDELDEVAARGILAALFDVGDHLHVPSDEKVGGFFEISVRMRMRWLVAGLLARVQIEEREACLIDLFDGGLALTVCVDVVDAVLAVQQGKGADSREKDAFGSVNETVLEALKDKIRGKALLRRDTILEVPELDYVIDRLKIWSGLNSVRRVLVPYLLDTHGVAQALPKFVRYSRVQSGNDPIVRRKPHVDPREFDGIVSTEWMQMTVDKMIGEDHAPESIEAGRAYIAALSKLDAGQSAGPWDD